METDLPEISLTAWTAFLAMDKSKRHYFGYLQQLENKYQHGGVKTLAENERLEKLLEAHDLKVFEFKKVSVELRSVDAAAHSRLIEHIAAFNAVIVTGDSEN